VGGKVVWKKGDKLCCFFTNNALEIKSKIYQFKLAGENTKRKKEKGLAFLQSPYSI